MALTGLAIVASACSGSPDTSLGSGFTLGTPTANLAVQASVGTGEGRLNLVAWQGYAEPAWVNPFEQQTGCQVTVRYAGSSSGMVSFLAHGGGRHYDLVSASSDVGPSLIHGGDVRPINIGLIPSWSQFHPFLQNPSFNTVAGKHYGVSYEFGPDVLLYNKQAFPTAPTSWSTLYDPQYAGRISVPNNPIQIADAALYLSKKNPRLAITDPYELSPSQFQATINLLKQQKPLVKKYWDLALQEISLFQDSSVVVGAAWPYQTDTLQAANVPVADTIPKEGATAWADSWMLATKAPHPNCAYRWMQWASTAKVQAQQAISFGATPANANACTVMDQMQAGSCEGYHANAPDAFFRTIRFWKTPLAQCDNGRNDCVAFQQWESAWTQLAG